MLIYIYIYRERGYAYIYIYICVCVCVCTKKEKICILEYAENNKLLSKKKKKGLHLLIIFFCVTYHRIDFKIYISYIWVVQISKINKLLFFTCVLSVFVSREKSSRHVTNPSTFNISHSFSYFHLMKIINCVIQMKP